MREAGLKAELDTAAPEQPSPVSVLDGSVYKDDSPSPVKQIRNNSKGSFYFFLRMSADLTHFSFC